MKKLIFILVFLLAGCIGRDTFAWEVSTVTENDVLIVDCSEQLNKTDQDFGVECSIEITDETEIKNEEGQSLSIEDLKPGSKVEVTLTTSIEIDIKENYKAKQIILLSRTGD